MRTLPRELRAALLTVRRLELLADGLHRQNHAIAATGSLMLAAVEAGWSQGEVADAIGLNRRTVSNRIAAARRRYGDAVPGLAVDAPATRAPGPMAVLGQPVDLREWLALDEAAVFAQCATATVFNWHRNGLLPNTQRPRSNFYLYLRADLRRALRAPRYNGRGVDYRALRAEIEASAV